VDTLAVTRRGCSLRTFITVNPSMGYTGTHYQHCHPAGGLRDSPWSCLSTRAGGRVLKTCTLRSFPANGKNKKKMSRIRQGETNGFSLPPLGSPVPPLRVGTLQLRKSTRVRCIVAWAIRFASRSQHQYAQTLMRTCGNGTTCRRELIQIFTCYYSRSPPSRYIWVPGCLRMPLPLSLHSCLLTRHWEEPAHAGGQVACSLTTGVP
jgi:hypothetical protein